EPTHADSAIPRGRAIAAARLAADAARLRAAPRARLGFDPRTGSIAWEVSLPSARPLADFVVLIDARNGEEISTRDVLWRADLSATLFDPNPVVSQGSYSDLLDAKDRDSTLLTSLRIPVSLPRSTSPEGCLVGVYADARLGKRAKPVCRPSLDFTGVTRSDDRFEALMAYFHIDRTRAYVDSLGLSESLRARPQRVRANAIPADNSFYSSMTQSMTLGSGGVDDGEDADVIVHEYGHSLQDQAVKGAFGRTIATGSMGEGFGDYLAAAMSALVTGGNPGDACIFDWDSISYSPTGCGRRADRALTLKRAERRCLLEIHCVGEAWSGLLYELRAALGADTLGQSVMDRVVLESHFMLGRRSSFRDGARALIAADELLYAGAHVPAIEAELIERQFCKRSGC
ncbi:MAG TPA: M36 family metallopeptidase, partial [Solirubrobacterales bacterium]|nr:M36 family metallopeptidase [Solirubrobacterales bacterium]